MPLPMLPENTFARTVWLPPVALMSKPSLPLGAAPPKANSPPNVLTVLTLPAAPATSMPLRPLPAATLPSGMIPPTVTLAEVPSTRMPSRLLATIEELFAPIPKKFAWTVMLLELVICRPVPPLPLSTL